jgi:enoyl-CoA hydratase/carnithine racemase
MVGGHDTLPAVTDLVSVAEAAHLLDARSAALWDDPVLVVAVDDLDGVQPLANLQPPAGWPGVLIALSRSRSAPPPLPGPDVYLSAASDPPRPWVGGGAEAARAVADAVRRHPQAGTTLVQILRVGCSLGPAAALTVESLAYSTLLSGPEHHRWLESRRAPAADLRTDPTVRLERQAGLLRIILDRPERRNAYSARMRDELVGALELPALDRTITSVLLAGAGPNFCSGGDLAEFGTLPDPATAHGIRMQRNAGWRISLVADRTTVHLHGACIGAGIELAAFSGVVEAADDATIALPEVGMGLIPGAGGTVSVARRIGPARTAWLALTGTRLDAATARRWGLVDKVGPPAS